MYLQFDCVLIESEIQILNAICNLRQVMEDGKALQKGAARIQVSR